VNLTHASEEVTRDIWTAMLLMLHKSTAPQMKLVVPEVAHANLLKARDDGRLYVLGDFAILVDVGSPWHTDKPVLIEEIIIRFRRHFGNVVESAIEALPAIAQQHGCVAIAAGDTQIGYMAPRYLAAGFQVLGTQFYKEQA
jgi:hypothetical protein